MHKIISALKYVWFLAIAIFQRPTFSGLTSYGDAVRTGVFDQMINIDYSDAIFYNKSLNARLLTVLKKFGGSKAKTTIVRGFDGKLHYHVLALAANLTRGSAGEEKTITLANTEQKNQVLEGTTLELVPATGENPDEGYLPGGSPNSRTKYVKVSSKTVSGDTGNVQVKIKPINPAHLIAASTSGYAVYITGSVYEQYSKSVKAVSMQPTTIENVVQLFKTPYEYDDIAALENLYVKGTLKQMLDDQTKRKHLIERELSLLFNGRMYRKKAGYDDNGALSSIDTTDIGYQQGIVYSVKTAVGARAVNSYVAGNFDYQTFENWVYPLFDPEIDDEPGRRFVPCNKAARHFFTELESQKLCKMTPNETYGIRGITQVETSWGMLDLMVHPRIDERWKLKTQPWMLALNLNQIEHKPMIDTYLAAGIQDNDITGKKAEYRTAETYLIHNPATHHGLIYPV